MNEFEIWIYRGLIALLLGVVWYFIKSGFSGIRNDIQLLINEVKLLNNKNASYDERFKHIIEKQEVTDDKIENIEKNIKTIELNQASCKNRAI